MIVIDASALLDLLLGTERAERIAARVLVSGERLHAPHLLDLEIAQVLRRLVQLKDISAARAEHALDDFGGIVVERHPHGPLLPRIWDLRASMSAYDGAYVALAEGLDAPLLTCDARLGRARGHRAAIEVFA